MVDIEYRRISLYLCEESLCVVDTPMECTKKWRTQIIDIYYWQYELNIIWDDKLLLLLNSMSFHKLLGYYEMTNIVSLAFCSLCTATCTVYSGKACKLHVKPCLLRVHSLPPHSLARSLAVFYSLIILLFRCTNYHITDRRRSRESGIELEKVGDQMR